MIFPAEGRDFQASQQSSSVAAAGAASSAVATHQRSPFASAATHAAAATAAANAHAAAAPAPSPACHAYYTQVGVPSLPVYIWQGRCPQRSRCVSARACICDDEARALPEWDLHLKPPELHVSHISRPGPVPLSCQACCCRQLLGAPGAPVPSGSAPRMLSPRSMPPGARPLKSPARPYQPIQPGQPAQFGQSILVSLLTSPPIHTGASQPVGGSSMTSNALTAAGISWRPCRQCAGRGR